MLPKWFQEWLPRSWRLRLEQRDLIRERAQCRIKINVAGYRGNTSKDPIRRGASRQETRRAKARIVEIDARLDHIHEKLRRT